MSSSNVTIVRETKPMVTKGGVTIVREGGANPGERMSKSDFSSPIKSRGGVTIVRETGVNPNGKVSSVKYSEPVHSKGGVTIVREERPQPPKVLQPTTSSQLVKKTKGGGKELVQNAAFMDMQTRMSLEMEKRKKDWETQVERMADDFFNLAPGTVKSHQGVSRHIEITPITEPRCHDYELTDVCNPNKHFYDEKEDGSKVFQMRFDLEGFELQDISCRIEDKTVRLSATQGDDNGMGGRRITKQFNRQMDIPDNVHPEKLEAFLDEFGLLVIEAPVEFIPPKAVGTYYDHNPHQEFQPIEPAGKREVVSHEFPPGQFDVAVDSYGITPAKFQNLLVNDVKPTLKIDYTEPTVVETDRGKLLRLVVDVGKAYQPNDMLIKLDGRKLSVKAKQEEYVDGRRSKREFSRNFDLPEDVEPETLRASLDRVGKLHVAASVCGYDLQEGPMMVDMPYDARPCKVQTV